MDENWNEERRSLKTRSIAMAPRSEETYPGRIRLRSPASSPSTPPLASAL